MRREPPNVPPGAPYVDENLVLHDPVAAAVIRAVEWHNCRNIILELHVEPVRRFAARILERGLSPADALVVVLNVDDLQGSQLAGVLMPGHDWDAIRAQGLTPYARGLAVRSGIQDLLDHVDSEAGNALRAVAGVAIVMMDRGITAVFNLADVGI